MTDRWLSEMSSEGARSTLFAECGWIKFVDRCFQDPQTKEVFFDFIHRGDRRAVCVIVMLSAILPIVWVILRRRAQ